MHAQTEHSSAAIVEAMSRRIGQIWLRLVLATFMVAGYTAYVGWRFAVIWGAVYAATQLAEYLAFPRAKLAARVLGKGGTALALSLVVLSNLTFAAFTLILAVHGGVAVICAAFLLAGTAFNSILTIQHYNPLVLAGVGPTAASALGLPIVILITTGSWLDASLLGLTVILFIATLRGAWKIAHNMTVVERAAREATEQADFAKGRFVANISHELRTPLNGVIASASLLQRSDLSERDRELVDHMVFASRNLQALIGDILDASKAEAGHMELASDPFQPGVAVQQTLELHRATAEAKGLAFEIETTGEPTWAIGDPLRVCQVIGNLTSNAIKFTQTGTIRIAIRSEVHDAHVGLAVEIRDSGIGMSGETAANIFKPFVQADVSITREYGGTGLGLSICRILSDLMKARLTVESEPGVGSTFHFQINLPLAPADRIPLSAEAAVGDAAATQERLRVLVVDDHPANRRLMELILEDGADIVTAENGSDALVHLITATFDIMITDMQMPVMDGPALVAACRDMERDRDGTRMPIILATADAAMTEAYARSLGADGVVTKPFTAEQLIEAVDRRWTEHRVTGCVAAA